MTGRHRLASPALAVLLLLALIPYNVVAQQANRGVSGFKSIMWGTAEDDVCDSVAIDEAGSIYIAGVTGRFPFVAKFSSDGSLLWDKKISLPHWRWAFASSVAVGPDNRVYVLTTTSSEDHLLVVLSPDGSLYKSLVIMENVESWLTGSLAVDRQGNVFIAYGNGVVISLNPDLTVKWSKHVSHESLERHFHGFDVEVDPRSGDLIISGANLVLRMGRGGDVKWLRAFVLWAEDIDSAIDADGYIYYAPFGYGGTLVKLSPEGDIIWSLDLQGTFPDAVTVDASGNIMVLGYKYGFNPNRLLAIAIFDRNGQLISYEEGTLQSGTFYYDTYPLPDTIAHKGGLVAACYTADNKLQSLTTANLNVQSASLQSEITKPPVGDLPLTVYETVVHLFPVNGVVNGPTGAKDVGLLILTTQGQGLSIDVWTERGGQGRGNLAGGQYTVGETVNLYCSLNTNVDRMRLVVIKPDGSELVVFDGARDAGTHSFSRTAGQPTGERRVICEAWKDGQHSSDEVRFTVSAQTDVKFRGVVVDKDVNPARDPSTIWFIKVDEVLQGHQYVVTGQEYQVLWCFPCPQGIRIDDAKIGDKIEVLASYDLENRLIQLSESYHYLKVLQRPQTVVNVGVVLVTTGVAGVSYLSKVGEWKKAINMVRDFYYEQSGGNLWMNIELYPESNRDKQPDQQIETYQFNQCGEWKQSYYNLPRDDDLAEDLAKCVDAFIDFTRFDYREQNGMGIVAFIILDRNVMKDADGVFCGGSSDPIWGGCVGDKDNGADEFKADGTNFDLIVIDNSTARFAVTLAHELGHWLGDLYQGLKLGIASLPDLYEWDVIQCLMRGYSIAKGVYDPDIMAVPMYHSDNYIVAHLGSFTRVWLGWNAFQDYDLPAEIVLKKPEHYKYGESIPRIILRKLVRPFKWLLLDMSEKTLIRGVWLTVEETVVCGGGDLDERLVQPVDNVIPLVEGYELSLPDYGIKLKVLEYKAGEHVRLRIEKYVMRNFKGMSLRDVAIGGMQSRPTFIRQKQQVDLDLHAYTLDGRHVGMNYQTNTYEAQIDGAIYSGPAPHAEWILVPDNIPVLFVVTVNANTSVPPNTNITVTLQSMIYDAYGTFHLSNLTDVTIQPTSLTLQRFEISSQQGHPTVLVRVEGDVDGNGAVDLIDLTLLARSYGSKRGEALYNAAADLNSDGYVDLTDLSILARNYGRRREG